MGPLINAVQCEQQWQDLTTNAFRHVRETEIFVLLFLGNCLVLFNCVLIMVWSSFNTVWANGMLYVIFSFISLCMRATWGNCFFEARRSSPS